VDLAEDTLSLTGVHGIVNRAYVIHSGGVRVACGVIRTSTGHTGWPEWTVFQSLPSGEWNPDDILDAVSHFRYVPGEDAVAEALSGRRRRIAHENGDLKVDGRDARVAAAGGNVVVLRTQD